MLPLLHHQRTLTDSPPAVPRQWHPMKYASMLANKMQKHGSTAW